MAQTITRATLFVLAAIAMVAVVGGCGRDNGIPGDVTAHLERHGIAVRVLGSEAPLSSRAGLLFFEADPNVEQKIIATFDLREVEDGSEEFERIASRVAAVPTTLWGATSRPAKLALERGGQLEYLYLLTTSDGRTYLLVEYAYG